MKREMLSSRRPSDRAVETRGAILNAAVREFAREGLAGARTDAIARSAGVNKALLYYYFEDKETLYGAALDHAFGQQSEHLLRILDRDLPPRRKILNFVGEHFDYMVGHSLNRDLAQREMMRAGHKGVYFRRIAKRYFQPIYKKLKDVIEGGIARGDFRRIDSDQFVPSMIAVVVFYFAAAPIIRSASGFDPLSRSRLAARRAAVLDLVSAALFRNPEAETQGRKHS